MTQREALSLLSRMSLAISRSWRIYSEDFAKAGEMERAVSASHDPPVSGMCDLRCWKFMIACRGRGGKPVPLYSE